MATWDDLKAYIHSNYKATEISPRAVELIFQTSDTRTQAVYVSFADDFNDAEWAQIDSPVGEMAAVDLFRALEFVENVACGGLVHLKLMGRDLISIRHCIPLANLDTNEFELPLKIVTAAADALEQELTGLDSL